MIEWFHGLFSDNIGGPTIGLFSIWHIMYLVVILGIVIGGIFLLRNRSEKTKRRVVSIALIFALVTYAADFFAMPFYINGDIYAYLDKLPFHICTSISIIAAFTHFKKIKWLETPVAVLCVVAPLMYMTYPGSALSGSAFSYRVVQTMLYHGAVLAYGVWAISTKQVEMKIKNVWKELVVIVVIALWATLGNTLYVFGDRSYNWFFMNGSPFGFPAQIQPFITIFAVYLMCLIIYGIYYAVVAISRQIKKRK